MFKRRSANYLSWEEYTEMMAFKERLMFMQNTVMRSVRNHYEKMQRVMLNG